MVSHYILSEYIEQAMKRAVYNELEDGTVSGKIPPCKGVIAFSSTRSTCEVELRSVLEDWILLGLKLGHHLPSIVGVDLNREPVRESMGERGGHTLTNGRSIPATRDVRDPGIWMACILTFAGLTFAHAPFHRALVVPFWMGHRSDC